MGLMVEDNANKETKATTFSMDRCKVNVCINDNSINIYSIEQKFMFSIRKPIFFLPKQNYSQLTIAINVLFNDFK